MPTLSHRGTSQADRKDEAFLGEEQELSKPGGERMCRIAEFPPPTFKFSPGTYKGCPNPLTTSYGRLFLLFDLLWGAKEELGASFECVRSASGLSSQIF